MVSPRQSCAARSGRLSNGGRYTYGSGAPLSTSSANYCVDPVFEHSPDLAPEVTSVSPGDEATSVPLAGAIRVTFDRPVQPGTTQITVKDPSNNTVSGTTTLETSWLGGDIWPSSDLASGTRYTVSVSGATSLGGDCNDASCHQPVHHLRR